MKKILALLLFIVFACSGESWFDNYYDADAYNFNKFNGKTVRSIKYCDNCGQSGDLLQITFTDGKTMQIYAYKYVMKIHK